VLRCRIIWNIRAAEMPQILLTQCGTSFDLLESHAIAHCHSAVSAHRVRVRVEIKIAIRRSGEGIEDCADRAGRL